MCVCMCVCVCVCVCVCDKERERERERVENGYFTREMDKSPISSEFSYGFWSF